MLLCNYGKQNNSVNDLMKNMESMKVLISLRAYFHELLFLIFQIIPIKN